MSKKMLCYLLCAKTRIEKENARVFPTCSENVPLNSGLFSCSKYQTRNPFDKDRTSMTSHNFHVSGFRNHQRLFVFLFTIGTIMETPVIMYGSVKSPYFALLEVIVISPITPSYPCTHSQSKTRLRINKEKGQCQE